MDTTVPALSAGLHGMLRREGAQCFSLDSVGCDWLASDAVCWMDIEALGLAGAGSRESIVRDDRR